MITLLEHVNDLMQQAERNHNIKANVIQQDGHWIIQALRQDEDRFYVSKRKFSLGGENIAKELCSAIDEIVNEQMHWHAARLAGH